MAAGLSLALRQRRLRSEGLRPAHHAVVGRGGYHPHLFAVGAQPLLLGHRSGRQPAPLHRPAARRGGERPGGLQPEGDRRRDRHRPVRPGGGQRHPVQGERGEGRLPDADVEGARRLRGRLRLQHDAPGSGAARDLPGRALPAGDVAGDQPRRDQHAAVLRSRRRAAGGDEPRQQLLQAGVGGAVRGIRPRPRQCAARRDGAGLERQRHHAAAPRRRAAAHSPLDQPAPSHADQHWRVGGGALGGGRRGRRLPGTRWRIRGPDGAGQ